MVGDQDWADCQKEVEKDLPYVKPGKSGRPLPGRVIVKYPDARVSSCHMMTMVGIPDELRLAG